jgi:hypothetical protein
MTSGQQIVQSLIHPVKKALAGYLFITLIRGNGLPDMRLQWPENQDGAKSCPSARQMRRQLMLPILPAPDRHRGPDAV